LGQTEFQVNLKLGLTPRSKESPLPKALDVLRDSKLGPSRVAAARLRWPDSLVTASGTSCADGFYACFDFCAAVMLHLGGERKSLQLLLRD